jgi:hypothetical protein
MLASEERDELNRFRKGKWEIIRENEFSHRSEDGSTPQRTSSVLNP